MQPATAPESDTVRFSAAISACEKGGLRQRALALLSAMAAARAAPNAVSFNAACHARCRQLQCLNAAISVCAKGGQWQWRQHASVLHQYAG